MSALEQVIPEGYKQTEVGVIPSEWEVNKVSKAFEICNTLRFPLSAKVRESMAGEYPYYGPTRIQDYINEYRIDGEYALIGEDGDHFLKFETVPQTQLAKGKFNVNNHAHVIKGKVATAEWFYLFFKHREITSHLSRQGAGRYKLNKATLEQLPCAIPPKQEQTAIANALSDVDALLTALEKLIAKKQAIKTAAMQQLLTGKTRLPQFATYTEGEKQGQPKGTKPSELGEIPEDWDVKTIVESCDVLTGFPFPSNKYCDSGIRLLRGSNVKRGETDWSPEITQYWPEITPNIKEYELRVGDIVVSMDGSLVGKSYAQLSKEDLPAVLLQRVARIRSESIEINYLKEWVCSKFFTNHCDSVKTVTAIPHISPLDIRSFRLLVPSEKGEQTAIAAILSDMDNEIQTLEQRLAKTRQIKQGMMQALLTGRIRLPFNQAKGI
ncbi:restriction endonuclease subunit S [Pseudoalteromonas piscicida]|uniref:Restriction endonuclease subunit S n=1 Tax=Pseudoalteromonas piscicida TaxID=43662 RepID=A0AAQ2ITC1_PSEO7|nr:MULTISPECIES: restriction endonuclease subunit S [Pseudoalteromonas]TMN36033.1 restriction endonuclease subunit S [Pseudoalteromonas piscicida]TMN43536.1 restriction endonuclease subunit S [Pseudoalteromonas piscicida]TMN46398.1 restriction endonuclease subunit S [Pseudoalteromonas piscicida]TMN51050.1 restriction endonuclease subunit S [Pseudoalteromonas piscicida]TMN53729.1 restriction endonuclease subunit S [Pseudoalteromonas piscicida]